MKILFMILLLLASCSRRKSPYPENCVPIKIAPEKYIVLSINRPKHFSVSLISLMSGKKFRDIGKSKHCNDWYNGPEQGEVVLIKTITYRDTVKRFIWSVPSEDEIQRIWCNRFS